MYLLFASETYYARGGWADLVDTFPDLDAALTRAREMAEASRIRYRTPIAELNAIPFKERPVHIDWWHIVELPPGKLRASGRFETRNEGSVQWESGSKRIEEDYWEEDLDPEQSGWWEE